MFYYILRLYLRIRPESRKTNILFLDKKYVKSDKKTLRILESGDLANCKDIDEKYRHSGN